MHDDRLNYIITCVADHLKIENIVNANELRQKKRIEFAEKQQFAVAKIRTYDHYYDVYVWKSVKIYKQDSRPKCDFRIQVDQFGQLYKKKRAGRRRAIVPKVHVGFAMEPRDVRLLEDVSEHWSKSNFLRRATQRAVYLEHLMWIYKDPSLHTRVIPNGWGLYKGDGSCISTNEDEIELLRTLLPYSLLLTR